ncbi:hypothetical protein, partial [Paraburkholderia tagetis]
PNGGRMFLVLHCLLHESLVPCQTFRCPVKQATGHLVFGAARAERTRCVRDAQYISAMRNDAMRVAGLTVYYRKCPWVRYADSPQFVPARTPRAIFA